MFMRSERLHHELAPTHGGTFADRGHSLNVLHHGVVFGIFPTICSGTKSSTQRVVVRSIGNTMIHLCMYPTASMRPLRMSLRLQEVRVGASLQS